MKKHMLWTGIPLAVVLTASAIVFFYFQFQSKRLDTPIFLDHYYTKAYPSFGDVELTFYYLTNKKEPTGIQSVNIEGLDTIHPLSQGTEIKRRDIIDFEQEFKHHYLVPVTIEIPANAIPLEKEAEKPWTFEDMNITFIGDNDEGMVDLDVDIGGVEVVSGTQSTDVGDFTISTNHTTKSSTSTFTAGESLDVEDIHIPFYEKANDAMDIKVGPEDTASDETLKNISDELFPFSLNKNDTIQVKFHPDKTSLIDEVIEVNGKTENEEAFTQQINIDNKPQLTEKDVKKIIADDDTN